MDKEPVMSEQAPRQPNFRIITWKELKEIIPYCRVHVGRLEKLGLFPQRIRLGQGRGRVGWFEHEVRAWILEKANASRKIIASSSDLPPQSQPAV
jgi:predicted DNA-binding transcriptional regulator AlpA